MKKRIGRVLFSALLTVGILTCCLLPLSALRGGCDHTDTDGDGRCDLCSAVKYFAWDDAEKELVEQYYTEEINGIDPSVLPLSGGWYLVDEDVEVSNDLSFSGDVHLILGNGSTLKANKGISVTGSLDIYAQTTDEETMGGISAEHPFYAPGIYASGDITIHGGLIEATGHNNSAGIGGGDWDGACGNITINGGVITAHGGAASCGIGTGGNGLVNGDLEGSGICGDITINGGIVTAYGETRSPGIGAGNGHRCGDITITGGVVISTGSSVVGAGIGTGYLSECGDITITGGTVTANGGSASAGIGTGGKSSCGTITIAGGLITANGGGTDATNSGAAIGTSVGDNRNSSCDGIVINGGYIKAVSGTASIIGAADAGSDPVSVTYGTNVIYKEENGVKYVGYKQLTEKTWETCDQIGHEASFIDYYTNTYYSGFPFTPENLIGDQTVYESWLAPGGAGYHAARPHVYACDTEEHTCTVCEKNGVHLDEDHDGLCDECGLTRYFVWDNTAKKLVGRCVLTAPTEIASGESLSLTSGWYLVRGNVSIANRVSVSGGVHLILADGAVFTAEKGIDVDSTDSLTFYAQTTDESEMGEVVIPAQDQYDLNAGIGNSFAATGGTVTFNGGRFTVNGVSQSAAIGAARKGKFGNITINGGVFSLTTGGFDAAAIGSGAGAECGAITINGGTFLGLNPDENGAAIGCGFYGTVQSITINGGFFPTLLTGGKLAAAIGSGYNGQCGAITIAEGVCLRAKAGTECDVAIGAGARGTCNTVTCPDPAVKGDVEYVGYMEYDAKTPDCRPGHPVYYRNFVNDLYYTAIPFTEEGLIGDKDALKMWKSEGGAGYIAPTKTTADNNHDLICDSCGGVICYAYNESKQAFETICSSPKIVELTAQTNLLVDYEENEGWYISRHYGYSLVLENGRLNTVGDVHLILANGVSFVDFEGIGVSPFGSLSIYAQSLDKDNMGGISAILPNSSKNMTGYAAIGSNPGVDGGDIIIHGGCIIAEGKETGIGSSENSNIGNITINGGSIWADGNSCSAGIGSYGKGTVASDYNKQLTGKTCGVITINGGIIHAKANGKYAGAAIGTGGGSGCAGIVINGGTIEASSYHYAAGIGAGYSGICGDITINGGTVTSQSERNGAGIGTGLQGICGVITVNGGLIRPEGGVITEYIPYGGPAIGASAYSPAHSGGIVFNGGFVEAKTHDYPIFGDIDNENLKPVFNNGLTASEPVWKSEPSSVTGNYGNSYYVTVGYQNVPALASTCTEKGHLAYVFDENTGNFYSDGFPFGEYTLLCEAADSAAWLAENGEGYIAPLGHIDENGDGVCDRCDYSSDSARNVLRLDPTCTESGHLAYVFDENTGNFYSFGFPFGDYTLLCEAANSEAWLAEGGDGYLAPLGHTDENADDRCDVCGKPLTESGAVFDFAAVNLALESDLAFRFKGFLNDPDPAPDAYMEFVIGSLRTERIPLTEAATDRYGRTVFTCRLNVLEAGEPIAVTFVDGEETVERNGTISVSDYLNTVAALHEAKEPASTEDIVTLEMVLATARYLHDTQNALDETHDNYTVGTSETDTYVLMEEIGTNQSAVNELLAAIEGAIGTEIGQFKAVKTTKVGYTDVTKTSRSLLLDDKTSIVIYLTPASGHVPTVTVTDSDGKPVAFTSTVQKDGRIRVVIGEIAATDLTKSFRVAVDGDGIVFTNLSALSYVYSVLNSDSAEAQKNGVTSLAIYAAAALAYQSFFAAE